MTDLILGIETSCDETAAAVVESSKLIRSSIVSSQVQLHERFGGVVPEIASRAHVDLIVPVIITPSPIIKELFELSKILLFGLKFKTDSSF